MKRFSILLTIPLLIGVILLSPWSRISALSHNTQSQATVPIYKYRIVNTYPHDKTAFTQGLEFEKGYLYEGTGLHGHSSIRKVELETGRVLKILHLSPQFFGEGITIFGDRIFQLTYKSGVGFVYDKNSFKLLKTFNYPYEGWGITHNGKWLITSDGTAKLHFLDPVTFREIKTIIVHDNHGDISGLNELEFVCGKIFANIWQEDRIAMIDPKTGRITGWIEVQGLLKPSDLVGEVDVLNGIAYDDAKHRLFITGKLWPKLFEIELIRQK